MRSMAPHLCALGLAMGMLQASPAMAQSATPSKEGEKKEEEATKESSKTDEEEKTKAEVKQQAPEEHKRSNAGQLASAGLFAGSSSRPWSIVTTLQFRSKIVTDDDPANDRSLFYALQGMYSFKNGLSVRTRLGLSQRFTAEQGESGVLFQDVRLGAIYSHGLPWKLPDWAGRIRLVHLLDVITPTSRASQNQSLILATQQAMVLTWTPGWNLTFGLSETWQQRFNQYAERAGRDGGMNVQTMLVGSFFIQYVPIEGLQLGADVYSTWSRRYNSRESFASASSDQGFWGQQFGWDVYAFYRVHPMVELGASVEHAQSVLDGGVIRTHFVNRDETEFAFLVRGIF